MKKKITLNEMFQINENEPMGSDKRCNCENLACEQLKDHSPAGCSRKPTGAKAIYIGAICNECSERMPKEFVYPPHGTARD